MAGWAVEHDVPHERARVVLEQDRLANGYAITDLEPPFAAYTRVALARKGEQVPSAALLAVRHPSFTGIVTHGDPDGVAALFASVELPRETDFDVKPDHLPVFTRFYEPRAMHERLVMAVRAKGLRATGTTDPAPRRLTLADLDVLHDLYSGYPGNLFSALQLETGIFFGVWNGAGLVAAGGTHVLAREAGLAGVGNVFTHPHARGRGYGAAITWAVTSALFHSGITDVFLTVDTDNAGAIRVYERLGFRTAGRVWQARARRRA